MDPTTPEFRPRVRATDSQQTPTPTNDSKWRTTCRTCGDSFRSRNQLMRHLYRTHPGKPAKPKTTPRVTATAASNPESAPTLNSPAPTAHRSEQSQVHPFILLSEEQKLVFTAHVLAAIFAVWKKQMEEEQGKVQDSEPRQESDVPQTLDCSEQGSEPPLLPPSNDTTQANAISATPDSEAGLTLQTGPGEAAAPDQSHQEQAEDDPELKESDDEDGGVALFGPTLGNLPFRLVDQGEGLDAGDGDTTDSG